jgi:hypothetical protein
MSSDQGNGGSGGPGGPGGGKDGGQGVGRKLREGMGRVLEGATGLFGRMARKVAPARQATPATGWTAAGGDAGADDDDAPPPAGEGGGGEGFETETMADLYAAQGLTDRARRIYQTLLAQLADQDGNEAQSLRAKLAAVQGEVAPGKVLEVEVPDQTSSHMPEGAGEPAPAGPAEPWGLLDWREMPRGYAENLLVVMPVDPEILYCYFEVTHDAVEAARVQSNASGHWPLLLRLHRTVFGPRGIETYTTDHEVHDRIGTYYFRLDPPGGRAQVAIGLRGPEGRFGVAAHSEPVLLPAGKPSADLREEWMEVAPAPARRDGQGPWPVQVVRRGPRKGAAPGDTAGRRNFWSQGRWAAEDGKAPVVRVGGPVPFPSRLVNVPESKPLGASEAAPPRPGVTAEEAAEAAAAQPAPDHDWRFLGSSDRGYSPGASSPWGGGS